MHLRTGWKTVSESGTAIYATALVVVLVFVLLVGLGLGLVELSKLAGMALPTVHDDPDRVEVAGLALLAVYGIVATVAIAVIWRLALFLPPTAQRGLGRLAGTSILLGFTITGIDLVVEDHDIIEGGGMALVAGYAAVRVALGLGLPFDDEDEDEDADQDEAAA